MLNIPEVITTATIPPINASGRFRRIIPARLKFLNS
jgi:hypothetical protein